MAEELIESTPVEPAAPVADVHEEKAREQGWKPKEEWEGNPDEWRPAKEFLDRGELFSKISGQNSEIKELKKTLNYLVDHHKKVKETEYNRALTHLKAMKVEAFEKGDAEKIVELDEAIADVKAEQKSATAVANAPQVKEPTTAFVQFVKNNAWYSTNQEMKTFADEVGIGYFQRNPGITETALHEYVVKRVKQAFPSEFQSKPKAPSVEGASGSGPTRQANTKEYALTEDERKTMMTFVRQGIMTKEEYIKDLKAVKGEE